MRGMKNSTVARKLTALRTFFRFLCREGVLGASPVHGVAAPEVEQRLGHSFPEKIEEAMSFRRRRRLAVRETVLSSKSFTGAACVWVNSSS